MPPTYTSINFALKFREVAAVIAVARMDSKLSQVDAAALIGRSASWWRRLEIAEADAWNTLTMADYCSICNLLDLNPASFFELEIP